jgi:glutamyl-tRNA synthetase
MPEPDAAAQEQLAAEGARAVLTALLDQLPATELEPAAAQALLGAAAEAAGVKKGVVMKSLRAALLGSLQGPDLLTTWILLQRIGESQPRLEAALA